LSFKLNLEYSSSSFFERTANYFLARQSEKATEWYCCTLSKLFSLKRKSWGNFAALYDSSKLGFQLLFIRSIFFNALSNKAFKV